MKSRYVLSPEAAADLVSIWQYIKQQASLDMADRVEAVIREQLCS
jgi:plasmid stabilization system protein ParE